MSTSGEFDLGGGRRVRRVGLGAMHLAHAAGLERERSIGLLRRAVELGVNLIDTAYMYGWGANEELVAEALHPYPDDLVVATKIGIGGTSMETWRIDGRPVALREGVVQALRRLRLERIDLVQLHRLDPAVPLADQLGELRRLRDEGRIDRIGLSEVTSAELAQARQIIEVTSVQNRYNILDREHDPVLDACAAAGIAFLPWRPVAPAATAAVQGLTTVAVESGATPAQVALAWLLARAPVVLPIPGTTDPLHLQENVAAADLRLSDDQIRRLDRLVRPEA